MKKKLLIFFSVLLTFPYIVNAEQRRYEVTATCKSNFNYDLVYNSPKTYKCSNGNTSPYTNTIEDSCRNFTGKVCNKGEVRQCYVILDYDCSRTTSGAKFTTTKKTTKRRITKSTNTTMTTTVVASNTKLKSLSLSAGTIDFNADIYSYSINVDSSVDSINVTAIPEDDTSKVEIKNNTNLENGSVITVIVTGVDNSISEYKIIVSKETHIMSSNAKLSSLTIKDYNLAFNPKINTYSLTVNSNTTELDINYVVEDEKSIVTISGNENLVSGSKVKIAVTAEDGTENIYTIDIDKEKESNSITIIFIIILILSILAGAYYIYKKFIQSKMGEKYEYE